MGRGPRRDGALGARGGARPARAPPPALETVVGAGESWPEALEDVAWGAGDVLVVGSSRTGPLARVFLGSRAAKIVRHAPVPVIVVPRAAAVALTSS